MIPDIRVTYRSETCRHCARPACLDACPAGAILKRGEDGIVLIDAGLCSGCGSCAKACPFGAIVLDPESGKAEKCDFCLAELEAGKSPICVAACPMRVLGYGYVEDSGGDPPRGAGQP